MANESEKCPLCGKRPEQSSHEINTDSLSIRCVRCGNFRITNDALIRPADAYLLSAFCRRARRGNDFVTISSDNVEQFIASLPNYSPPEKLDNLLQLVAEKTPGPGEYTQFDAARDYPLLIARDRNEVEYLMDELLNRGYVKGNLDNAFALTMPGWERLEEVRKRGPASARCFVAMWFDDSMHEAYDEAIAPAISQAGYEPLRIDRHEHVNRIDDEIIGQIKRSRFMVADFTGQRHGVYFETGLMLGLGRPVIWMCRKDELSKEGGLHFDIRQFNFLAYESVAEARKRLYDRILAIQGEGPIIEPRP